MIIMSIVPTHLKITSSQHMVMTTSTGKHSTTNITRFRNNKPLVYHDIVHMLNKYMDKKDMVSVTRRVMAAIVTTMMTRMDTGILMIIINT